MRFLATINEEGKNVFNYYLTVLEKYAVFEGRARAAEYWWFFIVNFFVALFLNLIEIAVFFEMGTNVYFS